MIYVYTGNGKGKTTAAIGQGIRVVGDRGKVLMVQFIKGSRWKSGEEDAVLCFKNKFKIKKFGKGFVIKPMERGELKKHKEAAEKGWDYARKEVVSGRWDLIILDEINVAADLELLKVLDIVDFLKKQKSGFFILTGRSAPKSFIDQADLVTEMKEAKHYYKEGIAAKKGREY